MALRYVSVFYPSRSFLAGVAQALEHCPLRLRLMTVAQPGRAGEVLDASDLSIIDASDRTVDATAVLALSVERIGRRRTAVYVSESAPQLEIHARSLGAWFFVGPLRPDEWRSFVACAVAERGQRQGTRDSLPRRSWDDSACGSI